MRYVDTVLDAALANWSKNVIKTQGGIMIEPYYNKVKDFGVDFMQMRMESITQDCLYSIRLTAHM